MKQKMCFLLMLAAMLFVACGDDDKDEPQKPNTPDTPDTPTVISFDDFSSLIDMSYSAMIKQFSNPSMQLGDKYIYENVNKNVEELTIAINSDTQTVYMVLETLKANAYMEADIDTYFKSKYKFYGVQKLDTYDGGGKVIGKINVYTYGNTERQEDATLVIKLSGNQSVTYNNPKNEPVIPERPSLEAMTPIDAANTFMLVDLEEIEEAYPGVFSQTEGVYMGFIENNEWLSGIAFVPVDGFIGRITILYNDEKDDQTIIDYYTGEGYTCTKTGHDDEEEADIYTITNGVFSIKYCAGRGGVTYIGE